MGVQDVGMRICIFMSLWSRGSAYAAVTYEYYHVNSTLALTVSAAGPLDCELWSLDQVVLLACSHHCLCVNNVCMPQGIQAAARLPIVSYLSVVPHLRLHGCELVHAFRPQT